MIADLEDAVAPRDKDEARAAVAAWLASPPPVAVWVRVNNHPDLLDADLAMVARSAAAGVVMPKADPEACEASPVAVQALIETAAGLRALDRIAAQPRVVRLALGEADLCAELSMTPSADGRELWAIRSDVVVASAAAGLEPPVGPFPTDLDDEEALARTSRQLYGQGFGGRSVLHPPAGGHRQRSVHPRPRGDPAGEERRRGPRRRRWGAGGSRRDLRRQCHRSSWRAAPWNGPGWIRPTRRADRGPRHRRRTAEVAA